MSSRVLLTVVAPPWLPWNVISFELYDFILNVFIALLNIWFLFGDRDLDFFGDSPHESTKFPGNSGHNDLFGFAFGP